MAFVPVKYVVRHNNSLTGGWIYSIFDYKDRAILFVKTARANGYVATLFVKDDEI